MKKFLLSMTFMLAFAGAAYSQGAEVFGGYSYQRTGGQGLNGFNAAVTGNLSRMLGVTGEISRHSWGMSMIDPTEGLIDVNANVLGFRFGPKITSHVSENASFFVQPLAGVYRISAGGSASGFSGSVSASGFTTAVGAGVDFRVSPRISIRPVQMDWIYLASATLAGESLGNSNGFRYSGGVVFKF